MENPCSRRREGVYWKGGCGDTEKERHEGVAFLSLVTERTETPVQGHSGNAPLLWVKPVLLDYSRVMGGTLSSPYPLAELFELPEKRLSRKQGKARGNSVVRKLAKPGNKGPDGGCLSLAGSFRLLTGRTHGDSGSSWEVVQEASSSKSFQSFKRAF